MTAASPSPDTPSASAGSFQVCTSCGHTWGSRNDFLGDPAVAFAGYQVNFGDLNAGYFLFTHTRPDCGTTLGLAVADFEDLYAGPVFREPLLGAKGCPGTCLKREPGEIAPCPLSCECAYVLEIIEIIKRWPRRGPAGG